MKYQENMEFSSLTLKVKGEIREPDTDTGFRGDIIIEEATINDVDATTFLDEINPNWEEIICEKLNEIWQ